MAVTPAVRTSEHTAECNAGTSPPAWIAAAVLAVAIGAVYGRSLDAPFIFDDAIAIVQNDSIIHLWPLFGSPGHPGPFSQTRDLPTSGRPIVNLSLALNYQFNGLRPAGYHLFSIVVHWLNALILWAVVRRTLRMNRFAHRFDVAAGWLALAVALLWSLHPLVTEPVIYATQRTELLMAFFYLATLYYSISYFCREPSEPGRLRPRQLVAHYLPLLLAILASACGMASKEVMVSAPLIVLLYDRAFVAGSFPAALRRHWPLYLGLASTWIVLLLLNWNSPRHLSTGFGFDVTGYTWWLTQTKVLAIYVRLVVWPWPLLIHYTTPYLNTLGQAWPYVLAVAIVGLITLILLARNRPFGFLGTFAFALLAPTSIIPILTEVAAERRMYLPLAAILTGIVVGCYFSTQGVLARQSANMSSRSNNKLPSTSIGIAAIAFAILFGFVSASRLAAFNDPVALWRGVLQKQPNDYLALTQLGAQLIERPADQAEGIQSLQAAATLEPNFAPASAYLGYIYAKTGRLPEAVTSYQAAVKAAPDSPKIMANLGHALILVNRSAEAVDVLHRSLEIDPYAAETHELLALALSRLGRQQDAIDEYHAALVFDPENAQLLSNLGTSQAALGHFSDAIESFQHALRFDPQNPTIQNRLGAAFAESKNLPEAIAHFQEAIRLQPDYLSAYTNLANALMLANRRDEVIAVVRSAIARAHALGNEEAARKLENTLRAYQADK